MCEEARTLRRAHSFHTDGDGSPLSDWCEDNLSQDEVAAMKGLRTWSEPAGSSAGPSTGIVCAIATTDGSEPPLDSSSSDAPHYRDGVALCADAVRAMKAEVRR